MPLDQEKVIDLVAAAGALTEKVAADHQSRAKQAADVAELIPDVVAALVAGDRITAAERTKMARVLADPVATLRFVEQLAGHRSDTELLAIGRPAAPAEKAAAYNSLESPLVGVRTTQPKESDRRLFAGLGLA